MREGQEITMPDLTIPTRVRLAEQRKAGHALRAFSNGVTGPYTFTVGPVITSDPTTRRKSIGGYLSDDGSEINSGSTARLRVVLSNDVLGCHSRLADTRGYYGDEHGDTTFSPVVARLPRSRGFLAGWTLGEGMSTHFDMDIYATAAEAARASHDVARYAAENEQEYQYAQEQERREEERKTAANYIAAARVAYSDDDVNVDDDAKVSQSEDGAWVQAWVWVSDLDLARD